MISLNLLREGAVQRKALDKIQSESLEMRKATAALARAALPPEETRARLLHEIQRHIERRWPADLYETFQQPDSAAILPDLLGLADYAWLCGPEELVDLIMKRLQMNGRRAGLPSVERETKLREMRAALDKLECSEELETLRLEDAGHVISRREDARPDLLLKVWAERETAKASA